MKKLILASLLLISSNVYAGSLMFEIGAGKNGQIFAERKSWEDQDGVAGYFAIRYEGKYGVCHYSHYSHWNVGPPRDTRFESSLDHIGCALRWKIY